MPRLYHTRPAPPNNHWPSTPCGVSCMVIEGNEAEFILGNDMLVILGIDVNAQLSQLAAGPMVQDDDSLDVSEPDDFPVSDIRLHLE